jgi:predicted amidohydrolase
MLAGRRDADRYTGALVQTYRKTHLFDLCLPKMTYKESDTYAPGDRLAYFDTRT